MKCTCCISSYHLMSSYDVQVTHFFSLRQGPAPSLDGIDHAGLESCSRHSKSFIKLIFLLVHYVFEICYGFIMRFPQICMVVWSSGGVGPGICRALVFVLGEGGYKILTFYECCYSSLRMCLYCIYIFLAGNCTETYGWWSQDFMILQSKNTDRYYKFCLITESILILQNTF